MAICSRLIGPSVARQNDTNSSQVMYLDSTVLKSTSACDHVGRMPTPAISTQGVSAEMTSGLERIALTIAVLLTVPLSSSWASTMSKARLKTPTGLMSSTRCSSNVNDIPSTFVCRRFLFRFRVAAFGGGGDAVADARPGFPMFFSKSDKADVGSSLSAGVLLLLPILPRGVGFLVTPTAHVNIKDSPGSAPESSSLLWV